MKTKLLTLLLTILAGIGTMSAEIYSGSCGSYMTWELNTSDKTLTFSGGGSMTDYSNASSVPWHSYRSLIEQVDFFSTTITSIGSYAFYNCDELISISIPSSIISIGDNAFAGCTNLRIVYNYSSTYMEKGGYTNSGITANAEVVHNYYTWTGTCGDSITWSFREPRLTISGSGTMENYSYSSGTPWGFCKSSLQEIIIEEGIEQLGTYAFCELTNVTSVSLPNSLKNINKATFMRCYNLQSINIPNTIERINQYGFYMCKALKSISIPSSVTYIGESAFHECDSLQAVYITDLSAWCNMEILSNPLYYAHNLYLNGELVTDLVIPDNVTRLKDNVFNNCLSITSITTPKDWMSIDDEAFYGCNNISSINWNFKRFHSFSYALESPFYSIRSQIKSITFGEEVSMIPAYMCYGMTNLTSVVIPNSVTNIYESAFKGCSSLSSVTIPNSVVKIDSYAFAGCTSLPIIDNIRYADSYLVEATDKSLSSYSIREGTRFIGDTAFNSCNNLISISIPEELIGIAARAFAGCDNLDSVNWKAKRCQVSSHGDKVFPKNITTFVFGDEVEEIPEKICYGMTNLSSITLGSNVKNIGSKAFYNCSEIKKIYVPNIEVWCNINFADADANPLTAESMLYINDTILRELEVPSNTYIDKYAFMDCSTLTSISIPPSISAIGDSAFYNCNAVTSIFNYSIYPQTIDGNVLYNIDRSGCTLYVPNESVELYREADVWNTFSHIEAAPQKCGDSLLWEIINDTLVISGTGEMWNYDNYHSYHPWHDTIVAVSLPDGLTRIGNFAFYNCNKLQSVEIPASVTNIGTWAWSGCYGITSVTCYAANPPMLEKGDCPHGSNWCYLYVPEQYLDAYRNNENWSEYEFIRAIGNCGDHLYWKVTDNVLSITGSGDMYDYNTFPPVPWGNNIKSVTMSEGVTSIGTYAFMHDFSLQVADLPNSITKISDGAFLYSGLKTITLPENLTQIKVGAFAECVWLKSLTCLALTPPTLGMDVFRSVDKSIPLYVPAESIEAYKAADQWKDFMNIQPLEETPSAIENSYDSSFNYGETTTNKRIVNGQILILRGSHTYTITGQDVK